MPWCGFGPYIYRAVIINLDGGVEKKNQKSEFWYGSYWAAIDWVAYFGRCEAYSTYPRTYDLLHAWTVFSDIEKKWCSGEDLLIEMDRILRPTGLVIIRDKPSVIEFVKKYLTALHWEAVSTEEDGDELVFVVQKKIWLTSESLRGTE